MERGGADGSARFTSDPQSSIQTTIQSVIPTVIQEVIQEVIQGCRRRRCQDRPKTPLIVEAVLKISEYLNFKIKTNIFDIFVVEFANFRIL